MKANFSLTKSNSSGVQFSAVCIGNRNRKSVIKPVFCEREVSFDLNRWSGIQK